MAYHLFILYCYLLNMRKAVSWGTELQPERSLVLFCTVLL